MRLRVGGLDFQGLFVMRDRLVDLAFLIEDQPQIIVRDVILRRLTQDVTPECFAIAPVRSLGSAEHGQSCDHDQRQREQHVRPCRQRRPSAAAPQLQKDKDRSPANRCSDPRVRNRKSARSQSPATAFPNTRATRPADTAAFSKAGMFRQKQGAKMPARPTPRAMGILGRIEIRENQILPANAFVLDK